jgi:hypothetical protein
VRKMGSGQFSPRASTSLCAAVTATFGSGFMAKTKAQQSAKPLFYAAFRCARAIVARPRYFRA